MATLKRSTTWRNSNIYNLTQKMRVKKDKTEFANWILQVGNAEAKTVPRQKEDSVDNENIEIDEALLLPQGENPMEEIQKATFPNLKNQYQDHEYLQSRAILTPGNETVDELNEFMLNKIKGKMKEYISADTLANDANDLDGVNLLYIAKYLNAIMCSGLPNHSLLLKKYAPVILLRNINQKEGLRNRTRQIVTRLGEKVLEAEILSGTNVGNPHPKEHHDNSRYKFFI
ncbi:PREDICTED: uncharacterized protein LOC104704604 [Camelina sativa]|uniref:Uncharacterized protein LOC104704604 n=1 Tax=Camelina sativa TaxID=90675 RepID=A0ABM0T0K4_CAMSA|nr:PREDICTED: uncharacterized protein LOC104704604 [Camelina sativa]